MIPCDSDDIQQEFDILLNELRSFKEELLDKPRVLAITKCDLMDAIMLEQLKAFLPAGVPYIFISAVAQTGLEQLKDLLWETINSQEAENE
jgi:GTPase